MALYIYVLALLTSFRHAWVDRDELPDDYRARLEVLAGDIVNAVEDVYPDSSTMQQRYAVTLAFLGYRETTLRRSTEGRCYPDRGKHGEFYGMACGYWSLHGGAFAKDTVAMLRSHPEAWCLPPEPWWGLSGAVDFLHAHPLVFWETPRPLRSGPALPLRASAPPTLR